MWCAHSFLGDEQGLCIYFEHVEDEPLFFPYISFLCLLCMSDMSSLVLCVICCWQKSTCRTFQVYRGTCSAYGSGDRNSRIFLCDEWEKTRIPYGEYFPITSLSKISNRLNILNNSTFLFKTLQGNATLHLYPHFKPLADFPGKRYFQNEFR